MKKFLLGSLFLLVLLALPKTALANEGVVNLVAADVNTSGRCFAASVFVESSYRIIMTCRDLKVAVDPENNKYVVWMEVTATNRKRRLGEIVSGKFTGTTEEKFDRLFVTLEKDSFVVKPVGPEVISGVVETIDFGKGTVKPSISPITSPSVVPTVTPAPNQSGNRLISVVTGIGKAILLGFVLLLVIVGVMSWLARRKSL